MRIKIAKRAGFCMGVRRAVNLVLQALKEGKRPLYTYGPLIHNPQTLELLSKLGVKVIKKIEEELPSGTCVIRAHGVPPSEREALEKKHLIIDGTCPRVLKVQALARGAVSEGKDVVIIGDKEHAEVKGILGYCQGRGYVVNSLSDIEKLPPLNNYLILSQTTQEEEIFNMLSQEILRRYPGGLVINTICHATEVRQREVKRLCLKSSAIIVIGGKFSANTKRLAQIAEEEGKKVFLIEKVEELPLEEIEKFSSVGITAGASTPNWLINEVVDKIKTKVSPLYSLLRLFTLLSFPEALAFFLLFSSLLIINPTLPPKKTIYLSLLGGAFLLFLKNLINWLTLDDLKFYYSLKERVIRENKSKIIFIQGLTLLLSLIFALLYHPRVISLLIVLLLLFFLLMRSPFIKFLDLLLFISLVLYLYPYWNEILLWNSLFVLLNLLFIVIYKELLYLQSDGFLPKNFLIMSIKVDQKFWCKVLRVIYSLSLLPFLWLFIKYKYVGFLIFLILLIIYEVLLYFLNKRPLGQVIYLENLTLLPPVSYFILSIIFFLI